MQRQCNDNATVHTHVTCIADIPFPFFTMSSYKYLIGYFTVFQEKSLQHQPFGTILLPSANEKKQYRNL
eukprot:Pgem_evm1s17558